MKIPLRHLHGTPNPFRNTFPTLNIPYTPSMLVLRFFPYKVNSYRVGPLLLLLVTSHQPTDSP